MSRALVYGGGGALGRACLAAFRRQQWHTVQVDFMEQNDARTNIVVKPGQSLQEQQKHVQAALRDDGPLDAIICCSGGWAGGNAEDPDLLAKTEAMISSSLYPSMLCASLGTADFLKPGGVLMLPGAAAVEKDGATPGMLPYGVAKAAVHQLINSLNADGSGLTQGVTVFGIAPVTLDTPMNREAMPQPDFSSWTPLPELAEQIVQWSSRPPAEGIYTVETTGGATKYRRM